MVRKWQGNLSESAHVLSRKRHTSAEEHGRFSKKTLLLMESVVLCFLRMNKLEIRKEMSIFVDNH